LCYSVSHLSACLPRATNIQADLGYIEYILILQHRSSWQNIGALKSSQAEVQSFCLELSKKLDMRYKSPPLPVNLTIDQGSEADSSNDPFFEKVAGLEASSDEIQQVVSMFDKKNL
jgi:hypothetical protein